MENVKDFDKERWKDFVRNSQFPYFTLNPNWFISILW